MTHFGNCSSSTSCNRNFPSLSIFSSLSLFALFESLWRSLRPFWRGCCSAVASEVAFEETWRARTRLLHGEMGTSRCRRSSGDWRGKGKMRRTRHLLQRERIGGEGAIAGPYIQKPSCCLVGGEGKGNVSNSPPCPASQSKVMFFFHFIFFIDWRNP